MVSEIPLATTVQNPYVSAVLGGPHYPWVTEGIWSGLRTGPLQAHGGAAKQHEDGPGLLSSANSHSGCCLICSVKGSRVQIIMAVAIMMIIMVLAMTNTIRTIIAIIITKTTARTITTIVMLSIISSQ